MELSSVIRLTTDPAQLTKLRNKAAEYAERYGTTAPECLSIREHYKMVYLGMLLEKGEINLMDEVRIAAEKPGFDAGTFQNVMKIINAYNSGDLSGIHSGTGLRE